MPLSTDPANEPKSLPRYDAWLAERKLLSAAWAVREAVTHDQVATARLNYDTAWMRFMVAICNLPFAERPIEVDRVIEALRTAHLLNSRGELQASGPDAVPPSASH